MAKRYGGFDVDRLGTGPATLRRTPLRRVVIVTSQLQHPSGAVGPYETIVFPRHGGDDGWHHAIHPTQTANRDQALRDHDTAVRTWRAIEAAMV